MNLARALTAALVVTTWAPRAEAHGGFPRAFEIIVEPGNPNDIVLRSDLWGFFRTMDGGQTWQWSCAEVYGSDSLAVNHQNIVILPGGRILVANGFKGLHVTDDFCDWHEVMQLHGELTADVVVSSGNVFVLTSTYKDAGISGILWQSKDNGDHFTAMGSPLPGTFAGKSLAFSPSNPERLYVVGRTVNISGGVLERSDDAGATWQEFAIPITNDLMDLRVVAVHPTRPDVVFVWGDLEEGLGQDAKDEIWGTLDGGKTWTKIYTGAGDLPGFAFSPTDATQLLIAGPKDGVELANLDEALAQGQSAFKQQFTRQVWGLNWTATGLTAGTDNFSARGIPAFTFGASKDEGKSFTEILSLCDVKYDACGPTSSLPTACNNVYTEAGGFLQDFIHMDRCLGGGTSSDAGTVPPPSPKTKSGCAVGLPSAESRGTTGAGFVALVLSALGLRALRRTRRQ